MIGWIQAAIEEHVLTPQATVVVPEYRAAIDPDGSGLTVSAAELDVLPLTTRPLSFEIGGGMALEHRLDVALEVTHGDTVQARRIRDRIVLDLFLRLLDATPTLSALVDPDSGQYLTKLTCDVSYVPLTLATTSEHARLSIVVETQLDR